MKNLPQSYLEYLLSIFNISLSTGEIPKSWKSSIIIPIAKPKKDLMLVDSYRPISLLPCIPKLLEKIINRRLNYHLEINSKFSASQNGFRKRLSTIDQITKLENAIRTTLVEKNICLVIFIDLSKAYDTVWHTGLIYKLQKAGIQGKMLNWINEYLFQRDFNVFFEGEYSCNKKITSGVPQGSTLSPTLFSVMINDVPLTPGVNTSEYADDIAFYCCGNNFNELKLLAQQQMCSMYKWTKTWGLQINPSKIKSMVFTNKKLGVPAPIYMNEVPIEYVKTYRYLGMVFDAPKLTWKSHIEYTRDSTLPRINILKAISAKQWGADRNMLCRLYKSLIRSRLDYGSMFYGTANHSIIQKLDTMQNTCIRLVIGAQKTSPILSIEVESNIAPLKIHRKLILLRYYCRLSELPDNVSSCKTIKDNIQYLSGKNWSINKIPPLIIRASYHFKSIKVNLFPFNPVPLISPIPPWFYLGDVCKTFFALQSVANISDDMAQQTFRSLQDELRPHLEIYTDGSKIFSPEVSCSAGMVIIFGENTHMRNFKLPHEMEIMGCELYAIKQALLYILEEVFDENNITNVVIYTDSLSSIQTIKNPCPRNYIYLVFTIHDMIKSITDRMKIVIQFIPGHKNIKGNELADLAANAAHNNDEVLEVPLSYNEKVRQIRMGVLHLWQTYWKRMVETTNKGKHLTTIKSHIGHWPWSCHRSRTVETVFAKLRIGHVNTKQNVHRFQLNPSPVCRCGLIESVSHILQQCSLYAIERTDLYDDLVKLNVNLSDKNLLGGGDFDESKQNIIINKVANYLYKINKLYTL